MKKFLTFIIVLILIALIVFLGYKFINNNNSNNNNIVENKINNTTNDNQSNDTNKEINSNTSQSDNKEEYNTTIYIGTEDNFKKFKVNIDKNASVTSQANQILNSIGNILGYKLVANEITDGKGGMTIDFNPSSAPFNSNDSYIGSEQYTTSDYHELVFTIFDSIEKTLQEYFGQNLDVWYSLDSGSITIDDINIPITEPYQGSNYYKHQQ